MRGNPKYRKGKHNKNCKVANAKTEVKSLDYFMKLLHKAQIIL